MQELHFGASVEDVLTLLGAPSRVYYKDEDKMRIHSPQAHRRAPAPFSDYFYNYFTLGLVCRFVFLSIERKSDVESRFVLLYQSVEDS